MGKGGALYMKHYIPASLLAGGKMAQTGGGMLVNIVIVMETRSPEELVMPTKNLFHTTILIISEDKDKICKIDVAEMTRKQ